MKTTEIDELVERSKDDRAIIVGSEIRGAISILRAELAECRAEVEETRALLIASVPDDLVCRAEMKCAGCGETMTARLGTELKFAKQAAEARAEQLGAEVLAVRQWVADSIITDGEWSPETSDAPARRFLAFANALAPPPAGEGDEKISKADTADDPKGRHGANGEAALRETSGDTPTSAAGHRPPACSDLASHPTPPATSTPDDDAERVSQLARRWMPTSDLTEADVDSLAALILDERQAAREAGRVEGWDEARERLLHGLYHIREMECAEDHDATGAPCPRRTAKEAIDNRPCSICEDLKRPDRAK